MTESTSQEISKAFRDGVDEASRWFKLLSALGFDLDMDRPGPRRLNDRLADRGFRRVLDEADVMRGSLDYPDAWWHAIAKEATGRPDARTEEVIAAVSKPARARALSHT